ncbi:hypothetical protein BDV95DRAFT_322099 [Massariosphaeria phaeospora]|uniref:Uncharacterized protein n=1 Tax=Massariosphaeria phaeospora TaxID=100035 RepID=A0A7C8IH58_9PLEO|nr:hypothetical protein BDV95DRAFT_322099 [Massariosphaeria phaeospora]
MAKNSKKSKNQITFNTAKNKRKAKPSNVVTNVSAPTTPPSELDFQAGSMSTAAVPASLDIGSPAKDAVSNSAVTSEAAAETLINHPCTLADANAPSICEQGSDLYPSNAMFTFTRSTTPPGSPENSASPVDSEPSHDEKQLAVKEAVDVPEVSPTFSPDIHTGKSYSDATNTSFPPVAGKGDATISGETSNTSIRLPSFHTGDDHLVNGKIVAPDINVPKTRTASLRSSGGKDACSILSGFSSSEKTDVVTSPLLHKATPSQLPVRKTISTPCLPGMPDRNKDKNSKASPNWSTPNTPETRSDIGYPRSIGKAADNQPSYLRPTVSSVRHGKSAHELRAARNHSGTPPQRLETGTHIAARPKAVGSTSLVGELPPPQRGTSDPISSATGNANGSGVAVNLKHEDSISTNRSPKSVYRAVSSSKTTSSRHSSADSLRTNNSALYILNARQQEDFDQSLDKGAHEQQGIFDATEDAVLTNIEEVNMPDPLDDFIQTNQATDNHPVIMFQRDAFIPIDSDFSEDESSTEEFLLSAIPCTVVKALARIQLPLVNLSKTVVPSVDEPIRTQSPVTESSSPVFQLTSKSSRTSTSPKGIEFVMENTYLGITCFQEFVETLDTDEEGNATKSAVAKAYMVRVAHEHAEMHLSSIETDGVTYITKDLASQWKDHQLRRRAKLGKVSLADFLEKVPFDAYDNTTDVHLLEAWKKAAVQEKELHRLAQGGNASRLTRRLSRSRSTTSRSSTEPLRGRRSI